MDKEKIINKLSNDLSDCISYDEWSAREYGEYVVDYDYTARRLVNLGYSKNNKDVEKFYQSIIDDIMRGCGDDKDFWVVKLINKKAKEFDIEIKE